MNRLNAYAYATMGFLAGFVLGAFTERQGTNLLEGLAQFFTILTLLFLWQWFESASHKRHLAQWDRIRVRGKWQFITWRYIIGRGSVLFVLLLAESLFGPSLVGYSFLVLSLTFLMAMLALTALAYQEWTTCEREFGVESMREKVEKA